MDPVLHPKGVLHPHGSWLRKPRSREYDASPGPGSAVGLLGLGPAQAVRAQLRRYWVRAAEAAQDKPWIECAIDPQRLAWTSRPYHVDPARREAVVIPGNSRDLATFATFSVADATLTSKFLDANYVPPSPPTSNLVEYRFEVSVSADNADLVIAHLWP